MAITPTYSWPLPDNDDLVKDGAEAIRDLGNAIDTTVDGLGIGLVHINTTSFSAVASQSINDVFSADYNSYKVILDYQGSTTISVSFRFRVGGADNSTANYVRQVIFNNAATTVTAVRTTGSTGPTISTIALNTNRSSAILEFSNNPFTANEKGWRSLTSDDYNSTAPIVAYNGYGFNATTSFDGFSIIANTGNITGTVQVFGYKG